MERTGFERLVHAHGAYLLGRARRLTRNEADARDLVQDTCLHALEAFDRAESHPLNPRGWLVTVMRHHWFSVMRHKNVQRVAHAELALRPSADTALFESRAMYSQLSRAWSRLPEQAQNIAEQCLLDGDSQEDVSRRFGITVGGVATSIHRTRSSLRESLFSEHC